MQEIITYLQNFKLTEAISQLLREQNASLIVKWVSTHDNKAADTLSRANVGDDF